MEGNNDAYTTIDEYITLFSPDIQEILRNLRKVIKETAPDAKERISYRMPAFELDGPLVYFAAFKSHIGFFPTASGVEAFKDELMKYKCSKGTVQFPLDKPIPYDLVTRMVKFKVEDNKKRADVKIKKKKQ